MLCAIVVGKRYSEDDCDFWQIVYSAEVIFGFDLASPVNQLPLLRFLPNTSLATLKRGIAMRDEVLTKILNQHKESFDPNNLRDFTDFIISETRKQELEEKTAQGLIDDVNLQQILCDLFLAGMETTTTMLTWCFAYLARYPDVQKRAAEERIKTIGDRKPRLSDRGNLNYFEAVIQEVLRMGSVFPFTLHKTLQDAECNGQKIPAGTQVSYNIWSLHFNEKEWKEPYCFRPERFLDDDGKLMRTTDQSFLPFGAGRRVCIGEALARMELFVFLSNVLWKYDIVPDGELPDLNGEFGISLKPKPFKVKLCTH